MARAYTERNTELSVRHWRVITSSCHFKATILCSLPF